MRRAKRIVCAVLAAVLWMPLGGCWDKRELSELAVVMGIALDAADGENGENGEAVAVCAQIANPVSGGSGKESGGAAVQTYTNFSGSGSSVFEVLRGMTHKSSRRLYNSHNQVILFGRALAETQRMGEVLDFFLRDNEIRYNILIAVVDGKAAETLTVTPEYENIPAREIGELIRNQKANSESVPCTLLEFVQCGLSAGRAALVPLIRLAERGDGESSGGESGGTQSKRLEVAGCAVFDGGIMKGTLNKEETRGALWVLGSADAGIVSVETDGVRTELEVLNTERHLSVRADKNGAVTAELRLVITANVGEVNRPGTAIDRGFVEKISEACSRKIQEEIRAAYRKSAALQCDVFGFGEFLYRHRLKEWRVLEADWPLRFGELTLSLHVQTHIEEMGELTAEIPLGASGRNGEARP